MVSNVSNVAKSQRYSIRMRFTKLNPFLLQTLIFLVKQISRPSNETQARDHSTLLAREHVVRTPWRCSDHLGPRPSFRLYGYRFLRLF